MPLLNQSDLIHIVMVHGQKNYLLSCHYQVYLDTIHMLIYI